MLSEAGTESGGGAVQVVGVRVNRDVSSLLAKCRAQIQFSAFPPGPKVSWNSTSWLG